jgi:hypothetical protein
MPILDGVRVVRSKIHGYGLVTIRPFKAGEIVVYGDGFIYHEDDDFDDTYALVYSDVNDTADEPNRYYDLTDQTRWINHACSPNSEVTTGLENGEPYAWWTALRDIPVGEEITYDYAFSGHLAEICNCQNDACIGLIVDPDELDDVPEALQSHIDRSKLTARVDQVQLADLKKSQHAEAKEHSETEAELKADEEPKLDTVTPAPPAPTPSVPPAQVS